MISLTPQPRYRLYTTPSIYLSTITGLFTKDDKYLKELTDIMGTFFKTAYVLPMPTARFAIYLAIKAVIRPGQKVILSPFTIVDVINMVITAGGIPQFADIDSKTGNISIDKIRELINSETGAVLITHLHGLAAEVVEIKQLCDQYNVPLIEDCAQAFSTRVNNQYVGTFGKAGIFSFGMYKILNSFYGGLLITQDKNLYEKINDELTQLPWFSLKKYSKKILFALSTDISTAPVIFQAFTYWLFRFGYLKKIHWLNNLVTVDRHPKRKDTLPLHFKQRMLPIQAKQLLKQLPQLEKNNAERIKRAVLYYNGLSDLPHIILPPHHTDYSHLYTYYPIQVPDRHALMHYAFEKKRDWVLSHYHNCANLTCFKEYYTSCPSAQKTAESLIYLPTYPRYPLTEVQKNIEIFRAFYE